MVVAAKAPPTAMAPNASAKYITTYYRRHFAVSDPSTVVALTVSLLRDDGGIAYLNGVDVFRSNMNTGAVNYLAIAPLSVSGTDKTSFHDSPPIDPGGLVPGDNVMAVEIHQHSGGSSSMDFALQLMATNRIMPPLVTIALNSRHASSALLERLPGENLPCAICGGAVHKRLDDSRQRRCRHRLDRLRDRYPWRHSATLLSRPANGLKNSRRLNQESGGNPASGSRWMRLKPQPEMAAARMASRSAVKGRLEAADEGLRMVWTDHSHKVSIRRPVDPVDGTAH